MHKIKSLNIVLLLSFFLFVFKWICSYYFFNDDLSVKIIFDTPSDGYFYYIYTEALSSLKFNESFDIVNTDLKNIPTPFYAVLLPAILLKFFGNFSILILEFVFIFLFLLIFFNIFKKLNFSNLTSITFSLIIFFVPTFIDLLGINNLPYVISLNEIYNLRFPRPLIVNIFFYLFIFFLITIDDDSIFTKKNFVYIAIILSFSLSSFYYFFILEILTLSFFMLFKYKLSEIFNSIKIKYYIIFFLVFIFLLTPFVYFIFTSEPNYMERLYVIELSLEKKTILLKYLISKILNIKTISLIILISLLNFYSNKVKLINYNKINIFYYLFLSSLLSPFFFILLSSTTGLVYHFINLIVICSFLYFFIFSVSFIKEKIKIKKLNNYTNYLTIFFIIGLYNLNIFNYFNSKSLDNNYVLYREAFKNMTNLIKINDDIKLLTFDSRLMVWSILNNVKEIKPLSGQLVPKTHSMIEDDLINTFKYLNLDSSSFLKFFENKISSWRLYNPNTQLFFWGKYSASKLKTFNNSKNFEEAELKMINKTSPLNVQSIAIPREEIKRLKSKFDNMDDVNLYEPNVIFLDRNIFFKNITVNNILKCNKISNEKIIIYSKLKNNSEC